MATGQHPSYPVQFRPAAAPTAGSTGLHRLTSASLIASVVCMGLMAGLFWGFSISVMPGLGDSDDRTFVTAMQNINADIENGVFGLVFAGALLLPALAVILQLVQRRRAAAIWTAVAAVAYLVVLMLTMGVEVPLNNELAAAGAPSTITDFAKVRADFEGVWVAVNHVRTFLCSVAVLALGRSLSLHGRGLSLRGQRVDEPR